jgi:signal transduction histidine kinase/DNA-binding NarL/FixJ family response regulator
MMTRIWPRGRRMKGNNDPPLRTASAARPASRRRLVVGLVCAGMAGCFALLFFVLRAREIESLRQQLVALSHENVHLLQSKIERSTEVLRSIVALFELQPDLDRQDFHSFVRGALERQPELKALEWIPRVPAVERSRFEQLAHEDGYPGFQLTERLPSGALGRARARDEYFPVYFVEPLAGNEAALGFDLASNPERLQALQEARDGDRPTATQPVRLAQEKGRELGFLVFLPVYRAGAPRETTTERRAALQGFALAVFRIGDLLDLPLRELAGRGVDVLVFDASSGQRLIEARAGAAPLLRPGVFGDPPPPKSPEATAVDRTLALAERRWVVRFSPTAAFRARHAQGQAVWVVPFGLLFTLLAGAYVSSEIRRREEIERRVVERTAALSSEIEARRKAEQALASANDLLEARVAERTAALARSNEALQAEIAVRKRAEETAAAANEAKSTFLANMSHEIRTPLNAILGYAQILERDPGLAPSCRTAIETIASSGRHLLGLVNEILDLAKIEAGRMELRERDFDLGSLLQEISVLFGQRCREKGLVFRLEGAPRERLLVGGDGVKLRQVLINLVGNAVKFTETGEVVLRTAVLDGDRRLFEVADTGVGIPMSVREDVFEAFHQGGGPRKPRGGTGLGLTIARAHVELMRGRLKVESEPGRGSVFSFVIPMPAVGPAGNDRAGELAAGVTCELSGGDRLSALVIDDVRENREVLGRMLATLGCDVLTAEDGETGLAEARVLAQGRRRAVVFLDVRLPDLDGREVARALGRQGGETLHLVAHSASAFAHQRQSYLQSGFDDFLAKPVSFESLVACLRTVPDVRLQNQTVPAAPAPPAAPGPATPWAVTLPEALRRRLAEAARLQNATELRRCLRDLSGLTPAPQDLVERLACALRNYDMDAVLAAVAPAAGSPPAHAPSITLGARP